MNVAIGGCNMYTDKDVKAAYEVLKKVADRWDKLKEWSGDINRMELHKEGCEAVKVAVEIMGDYLSK